MTFSQTFEPHLSSEKESFRVDSILIFGNETTKDFVILNEITFEIGDFVTNEELFYNRERIYSLGLFNKVSVEKIIENQKNVVIIEVEESWYIFPLPLLEIKERDYKKLSYGFYLVYKNFRGRNETIFSTVSFGYNPSFGITYINPNLNSEGDYFLRFSSSLSKNKNRSIIAESFSGGQFEYKQIFSSLTFGKRINQFNKLFINLSFNYVETEKSIKNFTSGSERIDRYSSLGLGYEYDKRDLIQFPKQGNYFLLNGNFNGFGMNNTNYRTAKMDFRQYFEIYNKIFFKFRTAIRMTFGEKVPLFDYSLIGADEKVRGNFFKRIEDRNLLSVNSELYYPLIDELQVDISFLPIIPEKLLSYRIAVYTHAFADYGSVFKDFYKSTNSLAGYGFGISFLFLPYNIVRFELGLNEYSKTEFIFDIGTFF